MGLIHVVYKRCTSKFSASLSWVTHFYPVINIQFLYTLCQKSTVVQSLYTLVSKKYSSTVVLTLGSKCDGLCVQWRVKGDVTTYGII